MTQDEAKKQLEFIASLAASAQDSLDGIIVPFFAYGIGVVLGTIASYVLSALGLAGYIYLVWLILMPAIGVALGFYYGRQKNKAQVVRATDGIYGALWISIGAGLFIIMMLGMVFPQRISLSVVLCMISILLAIGYCAMGGILRGKGRLVLYILGALWLVCGVGCFFVSQHLAPALVGGSTFLLECVPAAIVLSQKRKRQSARDGE